MGYCLPLCEFVIPRLVKPVLEDNEFVILYDLGGEEKKYIKKKSVLWLSTITETKDNPYLSGLHNANRLFI